MQALYTCTAGAGWTYHTGWPATLPWSSTLSNDDFATWYGLKVTNGDVTSVELGNNHLVGSLPGSLSKLQKLSGLMLTTNELSGSIPTELAQLSRLQTLLLSQNNLTGYVPQGLASLPQLLTLTAANNHLTSMPDFSGLSVGRQLAISADFSNNNICFGPLELNFNAVPQAILGGFSWVDQKMPIGEDSETQSIAEPIVLTCSFWGNVNQYQWCKKGAGNTWPPINGATSATFRIDAPVIGDAGSYACKVTNQRVQGIALWTRTTTIVLTTATAYTPPNLSIVDLDRNWTIERTYDGSGNTTSNILAESKQFTDGLGRATQAQARRRRVNPHVFASETIYSSSGQPVVQTLAAPVDNQSFAYKEKFTAIAVGTDHSTLPFFQVFDNNRLAKQASSVRPLPVGLVRRCWPWLGG